jgi:hypothetical protein
MGDINETDDGVYQNKDSVHARIHDYLENIYNDAIHSKGTPGAVVTGQPGVGESARVIWTKILHCCVQGKVCESI